MVVVDDHIVLPKEALDFGGEVVLDQNFPFSIEDQEELLEVEETVLPLLTPFNIQDSVYFLFGELEGYFLRLDVEHQDDVFGPD